MSTELLAPWEWARIPPVISSDELPEEDIEYVLSQRKKYSRFLHPMYVLSFERPIYLGDRIPDMIDPSTSTDNKEIWMIEAPLNTVEIIEAILKPAKPFTVHRARHFSPGCAQHAAKLPPNSLEIKQQLYARYLRLEGRLEKDREISYITVDSDDAWTLRDKFPGALDAVRLQYISIPWVFSTGTKILANPMAYLLHDAPRPGSWHTYERGLAYVLRTLGLTGYTVDKQNYLRPGATPMPECVLDWYCGIPGRTQALPYYHEPEEVVDLGEDQKNNEVSSDGSNTDSSRPDKDVSRAHL
ncbi:unnamed protein product [Clonostachys solani]|uniref:Uncharacterized protein n=1 Tax=Clonostachys solani TaxID=160281 RepID=A0A9P0EMC1_9HYPO|nr:unnamed protein product [Clonostachys solani]